jgi:hypothetical protein
MINNYPDVRFNFANPNEHVPEVERSIRVIKERIRATYHRLMFDKMPRTMIKVLVTESAKKLNFFQPKEVSLHTLAHVWLFMLEV